MRSYLLICLKKNNKKFKNRQNQEYVFELLKIVIVILIFKCFRGSYNSCAGYVQYVKNENLFIKKPVPKGDRLMCSLKLVVVT